MDNERKQYWMAQRENTKKYMDARHRRWRELLKEYNLKFEIEGLSDEHIVKISRMYPLVRQIIASVAFNYPRVFVQAEPLAIDEDTDLKHAAAVMERAGNLALEVMNAKQEVHQAIFDALFCGVGWLKMGYNPPGDDAVAPYVANDAFAEDFPYIQRINPFNVFVDPICQPQSIGYARYILERIAVPFEFLKEDPRFKIPSGYKPSTGADDEDQEFQNMQGVDADAADAFKKARASGEIAVIWEAHDRIRRTICTFLDGVEEPIEEDDHPFRKSQDIAVTDPYGGEDITTGTAPTQGFIMNNGFQYIPVRFDTDLSTFYPEPPMGFVQDLQKVVVESVSRRLDQLNRFKRIIWTLEAELNANKGLGDRIKDAEDGDFIPLKDLGNVKEANWGSIAHDQVNLESDATAYEQQSLHVLDAGGAGGRKTATESSLLASQSSLNREWMQSKTAEIYEIIAQNCFEMWRDSRYIPEQFLLNIGREGDPVQYGILTSSQFNYKFNLRIDAQSMQPLIEEVQRDDTILLYDRLNGHPLIEQTELVTELMRAFRIPNPERKLKGQGKADSIRLAQIELLAYIFQGQDPGIEPGMDHETHIQVQNPNAIQQMQEFMVLQQSSPELAMTALQIAEQHVIQHQEAMSSSSMGGQGGSMPSVDGRLNASQDNLQAKVRSNAQELSELARSEAAAAVRQAG